MNSLETKQDYEQIPVSRCRMDDIILLNNNPCKITYKHGVMSGAAGYFNVIIHSTNIFTNEKHIYKLRSTYLTHKVNIKKIEYYVVDINNDTGEMILLDDRNEIGPTIYDKSMIDAFNKLSDTNELYITVMFILNDMRMCDWRIHDIFSSHV